MALEFKITGHGDTLSDVEFAVEEALKRIRDECTSGMDSNDSGDFYFEVNEE
jgi:hypothetical protein